MPLLAPVLASLIDTNLIASGANGENRTSFCGAVARGIVNSIVGASFITTDTGTITGVGSGTGIGITGLSSSTMVSLSLASMPSPGENAAVLLQAIMDATVLHLASATLTSTHPIVFAGSGFINPGTIAVIQSVMAANIDNELLLIGANGENRTNLANIIATGIATHIAATGTGTVVITGTIVVPPPLPGAGVGSGIIS